MRLACKPCCIFFKAEKALKEKVDVLILGEFPPNTFTGISMVNQSVFDILIENGFTVRKIDESVWNLSSISKAFWYVNRYAILLKCLLHSRIEILYTNFPISVFGLVRFLLVCWLTKIVSSKTRITGHIHRGDLLRFYQSSFINRLLFRLGLRNCHKVVVLSKKYLHELNSVSPKSDAFVLPNTSSFEEKTRLTNCEYKRQFLCISNFIETKGIEDLIDVFIQDEFSGYNLILSGKVYQQEFFKRIKAKSTPNIKFVLSPVRDELKQLLLGSDCFVMPSWNEGLPIVILEAISAGLPVIATKVGSISEILGDDYPFLVSPQSSTEMARAVKAFDSCSGKKELGLQMKNRYMESFSNKLFKEGVLKLFSTMKLV